MKIIPQLMGLAAAAVATIVLAAAPRPLLSNGPARSEAEEAANEVTALTWHRNVMGGDQALALSIMDRNFIQHDVEEPSGSVEFLQFFNQIGGPPGVDGGPRTPANAALKAQAEAAKAAGLPPPVVPPRAPRPQTLQTRLVSITDGDITIAPFATRGEDPGRFFGSNMFEVKNGKVTQEWYSGPTFKQPEDTKTVQDFSRWYAAPYRQAGNVQFVVRMNPASRAEREANKRLVASFFDNYFRRQKRSASKLLSADLRSHIDGTPQGAAFAEYARNNRAKVTSPDATQTLFLLGQGDLVAIGFAVPLLGDPGAWFATNLLRVKAGKIVEWWYSGYPKGTPALRYGASWPVGKGPRPGVAE
jgi:predicted SnoaL-like aldol condensation-catalyzing enzyme